MAVIATAGAAAGATNPGFAGGGVAAQPGGEGQLLSARFDFLSSVPPVSAASNTPAAGGEHGFVASDVSAVLPSEAATESNATAVAESAGQIVAPAADAVALLEAGRHAAPHPLLSWQLAQARAGTRGDAEVDAATQVDAASITAPVIDVTAPPQAPAAIADALLRRDGAMAQDSMAMRGDGSKAAAPDTEAVQKAPASLTASIDIAAPSGGREATAGQPLFAQGLHAAPDASVNPSNGSKRADAPLALGNNAAQWGRELLDALKERVELQLGQQLKQVHIRLDPPELGRLEISLSLDADRLAVQINASHGGLRDALQQGGDRLRTALLPQHGGGVEVNIGQGGEQRRNNQDGRDRGVDSAAIAAGIEPGEESAATAATLGRGWLNALV